jgi:hypothetical protein
LCFLPQARRVDLFCCFTVPDLEDRNSGDADDDEKVGNPVPEIEPLLNATDDSDSVVVQRKKLNSSTHYGGDGEKQVEVVILPSQQEEKGEKKEKRVNRVRKFLIRMEGMIEGSKRFQWIMVRWRFSGVRFCFFF